MLMAAGRRGFGVHDSRKRDRKNYVDVNGRKTRICREDERGFGDVGKIRVRDRLNEEKELGELSSDSEGSPPVRKVEGKRTSEGSRKRKFSPVLRDRDNVKKAGVVGLVGKVDILATASLPPRPPTRDERVLLSRVDVLVKSESKFVNSDHHYSHESSTHQVCKIDEEDAPVLVRNISSSRWAVGNDEFDEDEAEGYNAEVVPKKKGTPVNKSLRRSNKLSIHEFGEISREGPDGTSSPSSESGSAGEDGHRNNENERVKYSDEDSDMEGGGCLADSDSEETVVESSKPVKPPERRIRSCRSVDEFERLNKINEGTYGVVYRARDKTTGDIVALKKVKMEKEREGFPLTSLREINILLSLNHPSIVDVKEVVMGCEDSIFMVMEYMDHDLKGLMESMKQPFSQSEVKCLMLQLLEGVNFLHDNWVLHRDLKTSNLLFNNCGELKICDFGLSRQYGSPLKPYTPLVVTLWYRAPELLLGMKKYSTAIDMWSLGCIMAEMLSKEPLFNGKSELDQLDKIFRILGTPNDNLWPGFTKLPGSKVNFVKQPYNKLREKFPPASFTGRPTLSERGFDLLNKLLTYDPDKRITAEDALKHEWFTEAPFPKMKGLMPTYPSQNTHDRHLIKILRSPDPLEELKNELQQA